MSLKFKVGRSKAEASEWKLLTRRPLIVFGTLIILVGLVLASASMAYAADSYASKFTMYPSYTHKGTKAWVLHDLKPGDTIEDYLTVENLSSVPGKFKVTFTEGIEKDGQVFTSNKSENLGLLLPDFEKIVDLSANSKDKISFKYSIPRNFEEGKYLGVFYVESLPGEAHEGLAVRSKIGVRMYTSVQDTLVAGLDSAGMTFAQKIFFVLSGILLIFLIFAYSRRSFLSSFLGKIGIGFSLFLFSLNFLPLADAQNMEIEVEGAGYRLKGPNTIDLPDVTASFSAQTASRDFEDLTGGGQDLEIIDENGAAAFSVSVSSTNLTSENGSISNTNISVKNYDGDGDTITVVQGNTDEVSLASATDDYASLDVSRTLFQATSSVFSGHWRIYPSIQVSIPAGTNPGNFSATLTFTIS